MSQIIKWVSNISANDPAIWLALGSGMAIILIFLFLGRRQRRSGAVVAPATDENGLSPADVWLPPAKGPDERRRSVRRTGVPTAIQISDPKRPKRVIDGFVLDRSSGGLRLAMEKPFATGIVLNIRPTNAPPEMAWVPIFIRNCREVGDYFEIGCQFQEELPWNLLLMFG
jgi:hypothetical protein